MLRRMARVATAGEATRRDAVELWTLVPPERGSELALDSVRLEPGATLSVDDALHDTLLLVHAGAGTLDGAPLEGRCAGLVVAGRTGTLTAGAAGLECVTATAGAETDLHAPMGAAETAVALDHVEPGQATGARSFQVLYGPHNGSTSATRPSRSLRDPPSGSMRARCTSSRTRSRRRSSRSSGSSRRPGARRRRI